MLSSSWIGTGVLSLERRFESYREYKVVRLLYNFGEERSYSMPCPLIGRRADSESVNVGSIPTGATKRA